MKILLFVALLFSQEAFARACKVTMDLTSMGAGITTTCTESKNMSGRMVEDLCAKSKVKVGKKDPLNTKTELLTSCPSNWKFRCEKSGAAVKAALAGLKSHVKKMGGTVTEKKGGTDSIPDNAILRAYYYNAEASMYASTCQDGKWTAK